MSLKKLLKESVRLAKNGKRPPSTVCVDLPEDVKMRKDGTFELPKSAALCADRLYEIRERRLELQRAAERMDKAETAIEEFFINTVSTSNQTGVAGLIARIQVKPKPIPQVNDWDAFYKHVKRTGHFELLQRRLNEGAIKERWENAKEVPGVGVFNAKKVSCTKI